MQINSQSEYEPISARSYEHMPHDFHHKPSYCSQNDDGLWKFISRNIAGNYFVMEITLVDYDGMFALNRNAHEKMKELIMKSLMSLLS